MSFRISFVFWILLHIIVLESSGQTFPFITVSNCRSDEIYNTANLNCEGCVIPNSEPTNTSYECVCQSGFQVSFASDRNEPFYFNCTDCATGSLCNSTQTCSANQVSVASYLNGGFLPFPLPNCIACSSLIGVGSQTIYCDYESPIPNTGISPDPQDSQYIQSRLPAAAFRCDFTTFPDITACQQLANLCVLELYDRDSSSCEQYDMIFRRRPANSILNGAFAAWRQNLPMLFYTSFGGSGSLTAPGILSSEDITEIFRFNNQIQPIQLLVNKYDFNGTFLGSEFVATDGILQICPDRPSVESRAFEFGTAYQQTCNLTGTDLSDLTKYPAVMFDLSLIFTDDAEETVAFPIPILIESVSPGNDGDDTSEWEFVRRFFLVDSLTQAPQNLIRYASSMQLQITLQESRDGRIHPPFLRITYSEIASSDSSAPASFSVAYTMAVDAQAFQIALPILGTIALILAFSQSSSWRVRQGLEFMDGNTLLILIYYSFGMLAYAFYIVMFGYAVITLLFFKSQQIATTFPPNQDQSGFFVVFIALAFSLKTIDTLVMIFLQSIADIFLIDWERPTDERSKVSIWRTYFVANEWNEIQTFRKSRPTFQLLASLFFLEVVGFKTLALANPTSSLSEGVTITADTPNLVYNPVLRFAIGGLVYIVVEIIQVIYQVFIHERLLSDKIREFVDLCSVSNISIIIFQHRQYGYYIHGRSVHGRADTDMMDMHVMLKKEEENLTTGRGLESGSDLQTFSMLASANFRNRFESIYLPLEAARKQPSARGGGLEVNPIFVQSMNAYVGMQRFLSAFIDHSLLDLDYVVKDRLFFETFFDMEFQEPTINLVYFYNDPSVSFSNVLFYGKEFNLFMFDLILFTFIDYFVINYILAAVITYLIGKTLAFFRQAIGRTNLAKKTLVDKRFLV